MSRELSPEQIEHLFEFVKKKNVKYIDCQYEIVDHLASAIEEEMKIDENLDFNKALDKVYNRFPITGFANFVKAKEKAMRKYWSRKLLHFFRAFLQPPQIFVLIALFVGLFFPIYNYENAGNIISLAISCLFIVVAVVNLRGYKLFKIQHNMLVVKKYLQVRIYGMYPLLYLHIFIEYAHGVVYLSMLYSLMYSIVLIWLYGMIKILPKMIQEELEQKYAHIDYQKVFAK